MKEIITALIKAQTEMANAKKGSNNPYFNSKYSDLNSVREAVIPVLNANGICVLQPTVVVDGKNYVKTLLVHNTGESIESLTEIIFAPITNPQAQGSGITYARRYGLQSLVCIGADDDDGEKACDRKAPSKAAPAVDNKKTEEERKEYEAQRKNVLDMIPQCNIKDDIIKLYNNTPFLQKDSVFLDALKSRQTAITAQKTDKK